VLAAAAEVVEAEVEAAAEEAVAAAPLTLTAPKPANPCATPAYAWRVLTATIPLLTAAAMVQMRNAIRQTKNSASAPLFEAANGAAAQIPCMVANGAAAQAV